MTGEWESKLKRMAKGAMKRKEFMTEIKEFTREIVEKAKNFEGDTVSGRLHGAECEVSEVRRGPVRRRLSHVQMSQLRFDHLENDGRAIVR